MEVVRVKVLQDWEVQDEDDEGARQVSGSRLGVFRQGKYGEWLVYG